MTPGQEANGKNLEISFYLLDNNGILTVIRIASIRRF